MDREAALAILPETYARALRLRDAGRSAAEIAGELGIGADALPTLFEVAERKLSHAMTSS